MRIGILGGGQLGRMLALAGYPLGVDFRLLDPSPDACGGQIVEHLRGGFEDELALRLFADGIDVVTLEWENVPVTSARWLAERLPFFPSTEALAVSQDRLREKSLFEDLGVPTAPFAAVDSKEALEVALEGLGLPAVLKTRRDGYDGRGQYVLREIDDVEPAWRSVRGAPCILEGYVDFDRELSIIAVRGRGGETAFYPLVENVHRGGILRVSRAPADVGAVYQMQAEIIAKRIMETFDYVGVLAIELFDYKDRLLANEMAPRVHNSGHWTIEGAVCSQFENHVRAVAGLPIGSTATVGCSTMLNLIGSLPPAEAVLGIAGAHLHIYGKEPRPGRKLGHVTANADSRAQLDAAVQQLTALIGSVAA